MPERKTCFTFELDERQQEAFLALLASGNYRPKQVPYSLAAAEGDGFNCALYQKEKHGRRKLCVQGGQAQDFVEFFLEPNGVVPLSPGGTGSAASVAGTAAAEGAPLPHGGSDESGKGDYFGPLVVACCYVDEALAERLRTLKVEYFDAHDVKHVDEGGVRDCKLITNNVVLMRMGQMVRSLLGPGRFAVVKIGPAAYNRLYAKIRNINRLLAWAHGTCIEELLEKQPACPRIVVDQFAPTETVIRRALKTPWSSGTRPRAIRSRWRRRRCSRASASCGRCATWRAKWSRARHPPSASCRWGRATRACACSRSGWCGRRGRCGS